MLTGSPQRVSTTSMDTRTFKQLFATKALSYDQSTSVDAAKYGIQTLAPRFFGGAQPDLLVSGPNIGSECLYASAPSTKLLTPMTANLGIGVFFSGTV